MTHISLIDLPIERKMRQPGPKGLPFFGMALAVWRDPLASLMKMHREYGDVAWYNLGVDRVVMLNNPNDIRHVLTDNYENYPKSKFYCPVKAVLGGGIFLANGNEWLEQRRVAKPSFEGSRFDTMATKVVEATSDMLARWDARGDGPADIVQETMGVALDSVARAALGFSPSDDFQALHASLATVLRETERRVWFPMIPYFVFDATNPGYRHAISVLSGLVCKVIAERRMRPLDDDLLSVLIENYGEERPDLLKDQIMAMLTAGHETTGLTLGWIFHLLSLHPDAARRVEQEVADILGDRLPTFADVDKLTYCRMVFDEALRMYPPLYAFSRQAVEDDEVRGIRIHANTTVMVSPYVLHRHQEHWENPEGFDPERFAPGRKRDHHAYAYLPFGGGPRRCLGDRFGTMEALLVMAMVTQRYRVHLAAGERVVPKPMITLRPKGGIRVHLTRR